MQEASNFQVLFRPAPLDADYFENALNHLKNKIPYTNQHKYNLTDSYGVFLYQEDLREFIEDIVPVHYSKIQSTELWSSIVRTRHSIYKEHYDKLKPIISIENLKLLELAELTGKHAFRKEVSFQIIASYYLEEYFKDINFK